MSLPPLTDAERAKLIAEGHGLYVAHALGEHGTVYTLYKKGKPVGTATDPAALLAVVLKKCRVTSRRGRRPGK